jgi:hypothetical protein
MDVRYLRALSSAALLFFLVLGSANAGGTLRVQQHDGDVRYYTGVHIRIDHRRLVITSSDRKGMLVFDRGACSAVGALIRCYAYGGELHQEGKVLQFNLKSGTAWLNPTDLKQPLPHSGTQLPPHGILMAVETKAGTYASLVGAVDEATK